ncbi:MAG: CBS domain-containing protein [Rhodospirillales bacterium]|nr:CBS domain-containing protein [Rhodospirillales bacterium]
MNVDDAMTKDVVTVGLETTVGEIAALLVRHRISAVPVVSKGNQVIGIVSQTDLGHRSETGTEKRRKWWLDMFTDNGSKARDYIKSHGLRAQDIMTRFVVSVGKTATLAEVADTLDTHRVRQVPVLDEGKLVGMISRADLVRKLAEVSVSGPAERSPGGQLQKEIADRIKTEPWLKSALVNVLVNDGAVELYGMAESNDQRRALKVLVEGVPGVNRVDDKMALFPNFAAT